MLDVYSKNDCRQCDMVKKFLNREGIPFTEVNITNSQVDIDWLREQGYSSVPLVFKDSELVCVGFRPELLKKTLS